VETRQRQALEPEDIPLLKEGRPPAEHLQLELSALNGYERAKPLLLVVGKDLPRLERDRAGVDACRPDVDMTARAPKTNRVPAFR
jgi:hypothetical protein